MFRRLFIYLVCPSVLFAQEYQVPQIFYQSMMTGMVGNTATRLYLAPSPVISMGVVRFINDATNTLDVCVYELDRTEILEALVDANRRGIKLRIAVHEETGEDKDHDDAHKLLPF